ncbi:nitroreductase [Pseudodesulfovibrio sp. F-1]|uniref:Nitroreductase n=1 Tax=Pseudodesulfovibrio alkaliphilus TaxID=2661613 RepID=A0A7K1KR66_9BACT|nr:nitroreductase family protein [Pseudodesulfovibrio alkaliphilus]MUM78351.1 nitroreductase [Pseudodesulfovibrio alkaliphilus]
MDFKELVAASRTRRIFDESRPVGCRALEGLVDLARLTPSGRNLQPLKYVVVADGGLCDAMFPLLGWAGYFKDWPGPGPGERPTGYIVILLDRTIADSPGCDHGIAAQTIMLGAADMALGGCIIGTVNRSKLMKLLGLAETFEILLVLALGVPAEEVAVEPLPPDGKIEYWRGTDGRHHVPKRSLDELIVGRHFGDASES